MLASNDCCWGIVKLATYSERKQTAIEIALTVIKQSLNTNDVMTSSDQVKGYLTIQLAEEPNELLGVMFLTS